jgi:predicted AlkP superfamily pyrophosphatase or phosphodiesterase
MIMKRYFTLCILVAATQLYSQPKLAIGIVVDQMRYDYLTKYSSEFSEGGFKRFYSQGFVYVDHHYNYTPTFTGPGHASIFTGTTPAIHGIVGNEWYDKTHNRDVYCAEDLNVEPVGTSAADSKRSPVLMQSTTIGDQLRIHYSMRSKVIGLALKDRGAILSAGHKANGAYWFDPKTANFVSSTYYVKELPAWLQAFNEKKLAEKYLAQNWSLLKPESFYPEPDDVPYEKVYNSQSKSVFPYDLAKLKATNGIGVISSTPFGNSIMVDLAVAAIEGEKLGDDNVTDMLTLSFSSPDYIGHQFGPHSREVHDMYLRLDLDLKRFFEYLDKRFGLSNITIFLTADHGAADVPMLVKSNTGYYSEAGLKRSLDSLLKAELGVDSIIVDLSNLQVFLNHRLLKVKKLSVDDVLAVCKQNIGKLVGVRDIWNAVESGTPTGTGLEHRLVQNGYHPKRSGDLVLLAEPGWIGDYSIKGGTTHGSPFSYDTHVPMLWLGYGVTRGRSFDRTEIPDIAPTLAHILGCAAPNGTTGVPMVKLLETHEN